MTLVRAAVALLATIAIVPPVARSAAAPRPAPRTVAAPPADATGAQQASVPWRVGERAAYDVKFGPLKVGSGSIEVLGTETVRGREAYHMRFSVKGGTLFYKVNDLFESWLDTSTLYSLRYREDKDEGTREQERTFEIFPDRAVYVETNKAEQPSVHNPVDDGSFIYFLRTVPLEVGKTYEFNNYFRPDRNPVRLQVMRREKVTVPAGTFDAIVVRPTIKTKGIFSENGRAEVWFSDDSSRVMLQMKSKLSFGSLNLYLKSYRATKPPA